jgi:hypothetical protein
MLIRVMFEAKAASLKFRNQADCSTSNGHVTDSFWAGQWKIAATL